MYSLTFYRNTAKTFYAASIFFEILNQFGAVQPDVCISLIDPSLSTNGFHCVFLVSKQFAARIQLHVSVCLMLI